MNNREEMGRAKNIKSTMEDLKKPRPPSCLLPSLKLSISPWAWKASLFFWRRFMKKNPPKPHVIKPASSTSSSSSHWAPCKRTKFVPMPIYYTTNHKFFYYSYPHHNPNDDVNFVSNSMYGYYDVKSKARPRPYTASITPTSCDLSPNLNINMELHNVLPYFQLRSSQHAPPMERLPLYIAS